MRFCYFLIFLKFIVEVFFQTAKIPSKYLISPKKLHHFCYPETRRVSLQNIIGCKDIGLQKTKYILPQYSAQTENIWSKSAGEVKSSDLWMVGGRSRDHALQYLLSQVSLFTLQSIWHVDPVTNRNLYEKREGPRILLFSWEAPH